jgi:rsbT co-antagonist protein RsbR
MSLEGKSRIPQVLKQHEAEILAEWTKELTNATSTSQSGRLGDKELHEHCRSFLRLVQEASQRGNIMDTSAAEWQGARELLMEISRSRAFNGFSPSDTAIFVFSLKRPLFAQLQKEVGSDIRALADETWLATQLIDRLGLFTTEMHQKSREEVIGRQQQEMLELSTPVVKLWDGILALPLVGTLDSARTQIVMESLLERIVATSAEIAIIDVTGVPTVDTLVAQHLIKTVTAARLMGTDCIISGIHACRRPRHRVQAAWTDRVTPPVAEVRR